jgi:DNA-binding NtrC family response regulator
MQSATVNQSMNILVVDDELDICRSVAKVLKRRSHSVEHVLSISEAVDLLEEGKQFNLVIADLMMPQAGGIELLKIMRERWPEIPVLIITGYASIASAVETTQLGAAGYLPKPFTPEELEESVGKVVIRRRWKADQPANPEESDIVDVDMPFSASEVQNATSSAFVEHMTRSDVPMVEQKKVKVAEDYCSLGQRNCKRFVKKGLCQAEICPIVAAEEKKGRKAVALSPHVFDPIDVDMPFSQAEVSAMTSENYVLALGRSDMPVVGHWGSMTPAADMPNVLVVDDEAIVVNSARKALVRKGYNVEGAFTCKDALAHIAAKKYDLVLLDMRMADGNGLELISKIRKLRPAQAIVIVTGFASVDTAVEAIQKGATDYMPKPFTPEELYTVARRVLGKTAA